MASPKNLPPVFNATAQDIEMLLSAQAHIGSKNLQVHMEPYLWKTRPDGINVINIGKTWYVEVGTFSLQREIRETCLDAYDQIRGAFCASANLLLMAHLHIC